MKNKIDINTIREKISDAKVYLFDFDGTLVNLDKLNVDAFSMVFREMFGLDFTKDDFMKYISGKGSVNGIKEYLLIHSILEFNSEELNEKFNKYKRALIEKRLGDEVYLSPSIGEFLIYSKKEGKRNIIVTSSKKEYVEKILSYFNLYSYFEIVFDRNSTVRGKPDPEPFEKAIMYTGLDVNECIAFEDSFYGIQSAKGAGVLTIGILNKGWNDDFVFNLADCVIEDYRQLFD